MQLRKRHIRYFRRRSILSVEMIYIIILCIVTCIFSRGLQHRLLIEKFIMNIGDMEYNEARLRNLEFPEALLPDYYSADDKVGSRLAVWLLSKKVLTDKDIRYIDNSIGAETEVTDGVTEDKNAYLMYRDFCESIASELEVFPVLTDAGEEQEISYENSWLEPRTYGGNRGHEGTDIMAGNNTAGYFKIVSATDGTVEKLGWLEQGGYRVGVRSDNGNYYYYAHLHSYADKLEEGMRVQAGSLLGYMGDTGYSKVVGTTGKFPVHLHFGIYLKTSKEDMSINPYHILRWLEEGGPKRP